MKIAVCLLALCLALALALSGCGKSGREAEPQLTQAAYTEVQLDLSGMSGTVVYSMIYSIMTEPEKYLGQVIRLSGYYSAYDDTENNIVYHACVIPDASACCQQGIEFVWAGEHAWPADYPAEGTGMTVTGRLESYMEGQNMYLHLVDAQVEWQKAEG